MAMLMILKGQPSGYNRDLQEDKIHIFAASDTVKASLDIARVLTAHTKFNTKKISAGLEEGFLDATALAEYLVGKGVAFRKAHGIVGSLVACCEEQGKKLAELGLDEFKKYSPAIETDVYESIGAAKVVSKYVTEGAAGTKQAKEQIAYWQKQLAER
jgi:argininosuccinate lyase